jgi:putative transposase
MNWLEVRFKRWTKPAPAHQVMSTLAEVTRSRRELIAENLLLRQPLIVLQRQVNRPPLTPHARRMLVLLASRLRHGRGSLLLVKPDTLLRWPRQGFRLFWRRKSWAKPREPRITEETIALIKEMAFPNRLWGAKRIRDELCKLDIRVRRRTVQKYMRQARRGLPARKQGQSWATFLPTMRMRSGCVTCCRPMTSCSVSCRLRTYP